MSETPPSDSQVPFLGSEPPPLVARGLSTFLIALFVVTITLAAVVQVPETIQATFVLVPVRGADPVRAPRGGTIVQALANESGRVQKGARLFVLRSPGAADRNVELQTALSREAGARGGLANARRRYESETLGSAEEMKRLIERTAFLERMLDLKRAQLALTKEQADRARKLNELGLASLDQQGDAQIRNSSTAIELEQLRTDHTETSGAIEKLRLADQARQATFREEERGLMEKVLEARIKIDSLSAEPSETAAGEIAIVAPCEGTVLRLAVQSAGAVVLEGDTLCTIACSGDRLQAELTVPQGGLARLRPGQQVKLLYEAFPYQRFGVKSAIVRWASPAGVPGAAKGSTTAAGGAAPAPGASVFHAFAELLEQSIRIDGEERQFLPGMQGSALIVVGRRSVISHAFAPLRQLRESLR